jgi:hypothetical protein
MDVNRIPEDVAAAVEECWPDGVIEEFDRDESYFWGIHAAPFQPDFQSYRIFFLTPEDGEFEFAAETESFKEPEDPEDTDSDAVSVTVPGTGHYGCSLAVSYASPFAATTFCQYVHFEGGSDSAPDPCNFAHFDEQAGEPIDAAAHYRDTLGERPFAALRKLRAEIAGILGNMASSFWTTPFWICPRRISRRMATCSWKRRS